jgi:hypothetical protein
MASSLLVSAVLACLLFSTYFPKMASSLLVIAVIT